MDRFEDFAYFELDLEIRHLHSSMDRFEVKAEYRFRIFRIYLHSSMDRFEVLLSSSFSAPSMIYIPVWIDLKIF